MDWFLRYILFSPSFVFNLFVIILLVIPLIVVPVVTLIYVILMYSKIRKIEEELKR